MEFAESKGGRAAGATGSVDRRKQLASERVRGYVYGTIGVLVAVGAMGAEPGHLRAAVAALVVFVGAVAIWFAHVFSELVAERVRQGHRVGLTGTRALLKSSWPIVAASLPSVAAICLGWAGWWSVETSLRISTALAVVALGLAGYLASRFSGERVLGAGFDVVAAASLGVVIALLEFAVYHA